MKEMIGLSCATAGVLFDRVASCHGDALGELADIYRAISGIVNVQTWTAVEGESGDLVTCVIECPERFAGSLPPDHSGLQAPGWTGERLWQGRQIFSMPGTAQGAGALYTVYMDCPPELEDEFNDWYNTEHLPRLCTVPGVLTARRYQSTVGTPRYLAVYFLADRAVHMNTAWREAAETPWRNRVMSRTRLVQKHLYTLASV